MKRVTGIWQSYSPGSFMLNLCASCGVSDRGGGRRGWRYRWLSADERAASVRDGNGDVGGLTFAGCPLTLSLCGKCARLRNVAPTP